jgi:hypothetical protein
MTQPKRRVSVPSKTTPTSTSRLVLKFSPEGELVEFEDVEPEPITAPTTAPTLESEDTNAHSNN